jgi:bla regulator protein BlaR1
MITFADHLWQSTLFAIAAALLTLVLRKNRAKIRYRLWLAASLKFLLPFTLLSGLGRRLVWMPGPAAFENGLHIALAGIGHPFARTIVARDAGDLIPALLVGTWLCGMGMVLCAWYLRWRTLAAAIQEAVPLHEGREIEALRRMRRIAGIRRPIPILLSPASSEPGIFGILAPVLLWPQGISAHFDDAHLEAVLAHEVWHVKRRDNLAAALHMAVEAAFWFHPLVWWLGARLIRERERACDEMVLELGAAPKVYAESILKTCQFCAGVRLACVSGITGADLKERIVGIMTSGAPRDLSVGRRLLLGTSALAIVALPALAGSLDAAFIQGITQAEGSLSTRAEATMLQLLAAGAITGATCPNTGTPQ